MATGFTYRILEGCSFEEFVWACARAMTALIAMRDEPMDALIPERFEPDDYHVCGLKRAEKELAELERLSDEEFANRAAASLQKAKLDREKRIEENMKELELYRKMLAKVEVWEPPSSDHVGLKDYMLSQIDDSIKFDCGYKEPVIDESQYEPKRYREAEIDRVKQNIKYRTEEYQKEIRRIERRNEWIAKLRESVPTPEKK